MVKILIIDNNIKFLKQRIPFFILNNQKFSTIIHYKLYPNKNKNFSLGYILHFNIRKE